MLVISLATEQGVLSWLLFQPLSQVQNQKGSKQTVDERPQDRAASPAGQTGNPPQLGQGGLTHGRRVTPEDRHQLRVPEPVIGPNPWGVPKSPNQRTPQRPPKQPLSPQTPSLAKRSQQRQRLW